jgi:hypothetical protein
MSKYHPPIHLVKQKTGDLNPGRVTQNGRSGKSYSASSYSDHWRVQRVRSSHPSLKGYDLTYSVGFRQIWWYVSVQEAL